MSIILKCCSSSCTSHTPIQSKVLPTPRLATALPRINYTANLRSHPYRMQCSEMAPFGTSEVLHAFHPSYTSYFSYFSKFMK